MRAVTMHEALPREYILEELEGWNAKLPKKLERLAQWRTDNVGGMLGDFLGALGKAVRAELPHEELLPHVRRFKAIALANFRVGAGSAPFTADFEGTRIDFTPEAKTDFMDVDRWKDAYAACLIMRDMDGLRFLASVSEEVFLRSNSGASDFDLAYFRFLAHFFKGGDGTAELLLDTMVKAGGPHDNETRAAFIDELRYPELLMMQHFIMNAPAAFNDELHEGLVLHRKFWGDAERRQATAGWAALPLLGACAMAFDAKHFPIEVESGYLPDGLVRGIGIK